MVRGEAAWSFTVMFIQMWEWKSKQLNNYEKYKPDFQSFPAAEGYVMPYGDSLRIMKMLESLYILI